VTDPHVEVESLMARFRQLPAGAHGELHDLYTDGCAEMLRLEAQLLRMKRRLLAAEADSSEDEAAAGRAVVLRTGRDDVAARLVRTREIVRLLRTALDWSDAYAEIPTTQAGAA
jgi:hypothetical protein